MKCIFSGKDISICEHCKKLYALENVIISNDVSTSSALFYHSLNGNFKNDNKLASKYEEPQKKNPHRITVNQHVFPVASINRFSNNKGFVLVKDKLRNKERKAKSNDIIFCAKRSWDQRAENGYMRNIEDKFQIVANNIIERKISDISILYDDINYFYALWYFRGDNKYLLDQEIKANGIVGDELTKDQEEILESKYYAFARKDGSIPSRTVNGIRMQMQIDNYVNQIKKDITWNVIEAQEGEFIVPDFPYGILIPLTPNMCLMNTPESGLITKENLAEINLFNINFSKEYYFARDFSKCPT